MGKINRAVGIDQVFVDVMPLPVLSTSAPTSSDTNYPLGQPWVNKTTGQIYMLGKIASSTATWNLASPGASDVDTINALSPVAGNMTIAGGTNITDVNAGNTVTLNLDNAITLSTSVTSPIFTTTAVDMNINSAVGQDIIIKMGDAAAANKISFVDSASAEVASIDSNGAFTTTGLTFSGLLTANASATINTAGTALNLATDASGDAVNIGLGAARVITIGNIIGATSIAFNAGTGGIAFASTGAGDITFNSSDTLLLDSVGVLELNSSGGEINIGSDAVAQNMNFGTGAAARVLTFGNSTGVTQIDFNAGTGGVNIGTNAIAHTVTLGNSTGATSVVIDCGTGAFDLGTNAIAHVLTIGNVTGVTAVNINTGTAGSTWTTTNGQWTLDTGTGDIKIGTDAAVKTLTIGNTTGATAVNINSGTAACTWTTTNGIFNLVTGTGAINIGADAAAKTIILGNGTGATQVDINSGSGGVNLGTNAVAQTVTIGNAIGATSVVINSGTGALDIGANAIAHVVTIGNITGATAVNINSGTAACAWTTTNGSFSLITGTGTINIGADAVDKTINIGDNTGTSTLNLKSGTGGVVLDSGQTVNVTAKTNADSPYALLGSDYVVVGDTSAGVLSITLPAAPTTGRKIIVSDNGGSAGANNITINGNGKNISANGTIAATKLVDSNYGSMMLIYNGTFWIGLDVA